MPTTFGNSESLWIEVCICNKKCVIVVICRHPNNDIQSSTHNLSETLHHWSNSKLPFLICGDININLLQQDTVLSVSNYVSTYNSYNCLELITKPTRITTTSSTLIDHIYTNLPARKLTPGILINDLSDHLPVFVSIRSKISKKCNLKSGNRHDYSNFNAENFVTKVQETLDSSFITLLWLHHNHKMSISYHLNGLASSHQSVGKWLIFMCFVVRIF